VTESARPAQAEQPAGTEGLRRQNTSVVLRSLRSEGPATRAELAKRTGLAKATVGVIVGGLADAGVVDEAASQPSGRGRPGRPVSLAGGDVLGLGLELNVDFVSAVVVDLGGGVRHRETRPVTEDPVGPLLRLAREVSEIHATDRLVGATVAVPGLVRGDDRSIAWTPNLGLEGHGLAGQVRDALGGRCPVRVSNDANCAAYAESRHGAAVGIDHALYLTGTVGIGAGIFTDGQLLRGREGFAGEVGHMPVGDSAARCGCGNRGCWEAQVGLHAMLDLVGMSELETPVRSAEAVAEAAQHDPTVRAGLERLGSALGVGLALLANVLDPEVVVLGGYFVPLGDRVTVPAARTLDERLPSRVQRRPELRLGAIGPEAAATGAAEQALERVFAGEVTLAAATG
jgi:predicted NBD/HSP70 family sugar kinase